MYISYDGMLEPLGESQVVSYLERLASDWSITLVSFEKRESDDVERMTAMRARLDRAGITWLPRRYHKRPVWFAKMLDVLSGSWEALRWAWPGGHSTIHARGYLPALMSLPSRTMAGAKLLFDIRGFWADERADRNYWSRNSVPYRIAKWWERRFFESADAVVSLTHAGVRSFPGLGYRLRPDVAIRVIPTCVDLDRFRPAPKAPRLAEALGLGQSTVIGCIGSMTRAYMRTEMLEYLALLAARLDDARMLIVTRDDHEELKQDAARAGLDAQKLALVRANHSEMPDLVRLIDLGVFFIKPSFSARACAATKLGEFLACGVPVVTNDGIGDYASLVRETKTGIVLPEAGVPAFESSIAEVQLLLGDAEVSARCRDTAARYFDVESGVAAYAELYQALG